MEEKKKLGLFSVIATGVGVIVATSCLLSLGQGAGTIGTPFIMSMMLACMLNCFAAFAMAELNALMPNLTGGLAQYTLACVVILFWRFFQIPQFRQLFIVLEFLLFL